jgi:hypothetical protein
MAASAKKLAEKFVKEAMQLPPDARPRYLRSVAVGFSRLANDPRNAHAKPVLTKIGLEFAGAASKQHTMTDFKYLLETTRDAVQQLEHNGFYPGAAMDVLAIRGDTGGGGGAPGGVPGSPFAGGSPRMSIAPASWNADTTLGRQVTVKYAPTPADIGQGIQQQQTAAFWQGEKQEAQAMSIDIGVVIPAFPTPGSATVDARPFASVDYGSDGTRSTVVLDVGAGRRFTVVGNYISVNVGMDPPHEGFTSAVMSIGASIGAFAAPSQAGLVRTVYFDALASGAFTPGTAIPQKAAFLLTPSIVATAAAPAIIVAFFDVSGNNVAVWNYNTAGVQQPPARVFIPGDAFFFAVSHAAGAPRALRIPFELSI